MLRNGVVNILSQKSFYALILSVILLFQLSGCVNKKDQSSTSSQSPTKANVTTTSPTTTAIETTTAPATSEKEAITVPFKTVNTQISLETLKGSKISESKALELCNETYIKYINKDIKTNSAAIFSSESAAKFDNTYYYLVQGYNDMNDHTATFGWYFVNATTGEVYDAGPAIGELIVIPKN